MSKSAVKAFSFHSFKWEWRDAWVGLFWDATTTPRRNPDGTYSDWLKVKIYICPIPFARFLFIYDRISEPSDVAGRSGAEQPRPE